MSWVFRKAKKNPAMGGLIGFFSGLVIGFLIYFLPMRLYVVNGTMQYSHYMVIGSPNYELPNGASVDVEIPWGKCMVVNETKRTMVVEEVIYGGYFGGDTWWVEPDEHRLINKSTIDYFFDDEPPDEISVNSSTDEVVRMWLRKKRGN